jgi:hypothetical protein
VIRLWLCAASAGTQCALAALIRRFCPSTSPLARGEAPQVGLTPVYICAYTGACGRVFGQTQG